MSEPEPPTTEPKPTEGDPHETVALGPVEANPDVEADPAREEASLEATSVPSEDNGSGPKLNLAEVQASIEALLYASGDPLSMRDLGKVIPEAGEQLSEAMDKLSELYRAEGRGLQIVEVAGGFQITTRPEYHEKVSRLFEAPRPSRLSIQALETLAVVAYRQPVTVPELMELRGVRSASVVRTLLERKLIRIMGRKNVVGRPLLYGTTKEFLLRFGLKNVRDLPQLKDMAEVFGDEVAEQLEVLDALGPVSPEDILPADDVLTEDETSSAAEDGQSESLEAESATIEAGERASEEDDSDPDSEETERASGSE